MKIRIIVVLVIIAVGLCVAQTLAMFQGDPAEANRAALLNSLLSLASTAQRHYYLPVSRFGGNNAFNTSGGGVGISMIAQLTPYPTNAHGTYTLGTVAATSLVLTGTGVAMGDDGHPIEITLTVFPDSFYATYNN